MNAYFKLGSYGAAFGAGVFAMWLWHNASINRIEKKEAKQETAAVTQQFNTAVTDTKQAGENSANYLSEYTAAKNENATLRERLRDGTVRLRLCSAESKTAAVQGANSSAIADEASADLARYREDAIRLQARGAEVDAWVNSAHTWINR